MWRLVFSDREKSRGGNRYYRRTVADRTSYYEVTDDGWEIRCVYFEANGLSDFTDAKLSGPTKLAIDSSLEMISREHFDEMWDRMLREDDES